MCLTWRSWSFIPSSVFRTFSTGGARRHHKCSWSGPTRFTSWRQLRNDVRTEDTYSDASIIITCGRDCAAAAHPPPPSSSFPMVKASEKGTTSAWRQVIALPTICHRREARLTLAEVLGRRPSIWGTRGIQVFQRFVSARGCYFETRRKQDSRSRTRKGRWERQVIASLI
jgi:hypothetical protein